jgi:hypothetical protein
MDWTKFAAQVFGTVLSVLGAVVTVFLVDRLKLRRKAFSQIPARLQMDFDYIGARIRTIQNILADADDLLPPAPLEAMSFDIDSYKRLQGEVFDHLTAEQNETLSKIVFAMSQADDANAVAVTALQKGIHHTVAWRDSASKEKFLLERMHSLIEKYLSL